MLRRSHRKSRGGCVECKRRHVKCDEARPLCRLCVLSERSCTYTTTLQAPNGSSSPSSRTPSQDGSCSPASRSDPSGTVIPPAVRPNLDLAYRPRTAHNISDEVNFDHVELLIHITADEDMFSLADGVDNYNFAISVALPIAHGTPYLLYQMLAFSARHLAHLHPDRSSKYNYLAINLQTRAVSLFNTSGTTVTQENCVPMLLFASTLGHHILADTLIEREDASLDAFMTRFTHCLEMQRGIYIIFSTARPVLMESALEPVLKGSIGLTSREPIGRDCEELNRLIANSSRLTQPEREVCLEAARYLQVGFDAFAAGVGTLHRHQMCFTWMLLVPPKVTAMMATRQPDTLVILAYYASLLHLSNDVWQIGSSGEYIMDMITTYLGPSWDEWLGLPRRRMAEYSQNTQHPPS